jgi:hypothetical protein
MKNKSYLYWFCSICLGLSLTACNLPTGQKPVGTPDLDATVAAQVAIAYSAQTMVAQTLTAAIPAVPLDLTATNTIAVVAEATATSTLTPTPSASPTPEGITLTVSKDTYCRFGAPYSSFYVVTTIKTGQKVEVLSRNPENDSYFVKNPYDSTSTCWVYGKYATLSGDSQSLTVSTMHPTPTATATPTPNDQFTVSYVGLESCAGEFAFKLHIKNTGGVAWQYILITGGDNNTGFVINHASNFFTDYTGCAAGLSQDDLAPGEASYVLNYNPGQFGYDPTGNLIKIDVKLCSKNDGDGVCKKKFIQFTP